MNNLRAILSVVLISLALSALSPAPCRAREDDEPVVWEGEIEMTCVFPSSQGEITEKVRFRFVEAPYYGQLGEQLGGLDLSQFGDIVPPEMKQELEEAMRELEQLQGEGVPGMGELRTGKDIKLVFTRMAGKLDDYDRYGDLYATTSWGSDTRTFSDVPLVGTEFAVMVSLNYDMMTYDLQFAPSQSSEMYSDIVRRYHDTGDTTTGKIDSIFYMCWPTIHGSIPLDGEDSGEGERDLADHGYFTHKWRLRCGEPEPEGGIARAMDSLEKGGKIFTGSPNVFVNGMPVARVGDPVVCTDHGDSKITTGCATVRANGKPIAHRGSLCACGNRVFEGSKDAFAEGIGR